MHTLPAHSHFRRAVNDDDDLHDQLAQQADGAAARRRGPSIRDWTEHDELLACLTDVGNLIQQAIGASVTPKGKKPPQFKPVRRPQTAAERAKRRRDLQFHAEMVKQLLPGG